MLTFTAEQKERIAQAYRESANLTDKSKIEQAIQNIEQTAGFNVFAGASLMNHSFLQNANTTVKESVQSDFPMASIF